MDTDTLLINDRYPVKGTLMFQVKSEMVPDERSETGMRQEITIEGKLTCGEYFQIIRSAQSNRYTVTGIHVNTEGYTSEDNIIEYLFTADGMHVKALSDVE